MANNFLDKTGLSYFWEKIKTWVNEKLTNKLDKPSGGTTGQILEKTTSGTKWVDKPVMYVAVSGTTSDKSSAEIIQAVKNGYAVFARVSVLGLSYALPAANLNSSNSIVTFMLFIGDRIINCMINGTTATVSTTMLDASRVEFEPGTTGLEAENVQDAIDELATRSTGVPIIDAKSSDGINYTATVSGLASLEEGMLLAVRWGQTCGNAPTLNVNNFGAKNLVRRTGIKTTNAIYVSLGPSAVVFHTVSLAMYTGNHWMVLDLHTVDYSELSGTDPYAPKIVTVTLLASGWSSKVQTVSVPGVVMSETLQVISPAPSMSSQAAYIEAGVLCTGQSNDSLTFTCKEVPGADLTIYVAIQKVL